MGAGDVPDQSGQAHITQDGYAAQQQHKALAAHIHAQQLAQAAQHPEHQHIAGGIIRKIFRGIELARAQIRQALRPGGEAGHIGGIALGDQGQPDAQHSGADQQHQQTVGQSPVTPANMWFGVCHDLSPFHTHGRTVRGWPTQTVDTLMFSIVKTSCSLQGAGCGFPVKTKQEYKNMAQKSRMR